MTNRNRWNREGRLYEFVNWPNNHRNAFVAIVLGGCGFLMLVEMLRRAFS